MRYPFANAMNDTSRILETIRSRIDSAADPVAIINELTPRTRPDAVKWARRLPLYDEFAAIYGKQVVGLARTIAKRALRQQGLRVTEDGRIIEEVGLRPRRSDAKPTRAFLLPIRDSEVKVEYTRNYFPHTDQDAFYFVRVDYVRPPPEAPYQLPDAAKPHPLSDTGFLNHFSDHDAVEACGGPEAYARLFAAAQLRGEAKQFDAAFEVVGEHTARVVEETPADQPIQKKVSQQTLF
jgi:hypothetical protein